MRDITKDTRLCISLSARPTNIGTRFHNHLYEKLDLDFVYKAFSATDIRDAIAGVRGLGIRGCSVSMPWKEDVIALQAAEQFALYTGVRPTPGQVAEASAYSRA